MKTESSSDVNLTVAAIPIRDGLHKLPSAIGGSGDSFQFKVFIYTLSDPITDEVRYVGKTMYPRIRYMTHLGHARRNKRKSHKNSWIRGLILNGLEPRMTVIQEVVSNDEAVWQEAERIWIEFYRNAGCNLTNLASGGHGGMKHSFESREKMRRIQNSPEVIAKQRKAYYKRYMERLKNNLEFDFGSAATSRH